MSHPIDDPVVPMTLGVGDEAAGLDIQCHGLFDAGNGRVLIWCEPDDEELITRNSGTVAPYFVFWVWNVSERKGSPGDGWTYTTAKAARARFAREVAQAVQ